MKLEFVDWGLANCFDDGTIEIHKDLKDYPDLFNPILKHELEHTVEGYKVKDFMIDLIPLKLNHLKLYWFMLKRPKTWIQFSPIWFTKKRGLVLDWGHMGILLLYGAFTFFLFKFLNGFV